MKKLINFPHLLGQKKLGVNKTGRYLKKVLANDFVDVKCNNSIRNRYPNMVNNLWKLYRENILHNNKINIGGDHSMSLATVADSLNRTEEDQLKVLWFDAHPDINTYQSSPSKNIIISESFAKCAPMYLLYPALRLVELCNKRILL